MSESRISKGQLCGAKHVLWPLEIYDLIVTSKRKIPMRTIYLISMACWHSEEKRPLENLSTKYKVYILLQWELKSRKSYGFISNYILSKLPSYTPNACSAHVFKVWFLFISSTPQIYVPLKQLFGNKWVNTTQYLKQMHWNINVEEWSRSRRWLVCLWLLI